MPDMVVRQAVRARRFWWAPLPLLLLVLLSAAAIDFSRGATPSAAGGIASLFGNVDCNDSLDAVDPLFDLRTVAALPVTQHEPCPDIGTHVLTDGEDTIFGDTDCDGNLAATDALRDLRWIAGLPISHRDSARSVGSQGGASCPSPGDPVTIGKAPNDTPTPTPAPGPDIKSLNVDFTIIGIIHPMSGGVSSQFFHNETVDTVVMTAVHNNGPAVADAWVDLDISKVDAGDFDFIYQAQAGDICYHFDMEVPCQTASGITNIRVPLPQLPVSVSQSVSRHVYVICKQTGDYRFTVYSDAGPFDGDPNRTNNISDLRVRTPDYPECVEPPPP